LDSPAQDWLENSGFSGGKKVFSKIACGWHGMGYVETALHKGRSVFPV
jgi:hypothetical protein